MIALRPYQQHAVQSARDAIAAGKRRVILVAPTGSGKTIIAASIIHSAVQRGKSVLFIAHRKELIDQASNKLDMFGIDHGVIMATHWRKRPHLDVQVASVQTLARRAKPCADLIIIDEAHLSLAKSYTDLVAEYPDAVVLGLTATPIRADGKPLGAMYHDIIPVSDIQQLIRMGFLVRPRHYAPSRPDLTKISIKRGDYDEAELAANIDTPDIVGDIVSHWHALARGRTTAVFAVNIDHSRHIAGQFVASGVRAEHVDGTTPRWQREGILKRFASGETTVCSSVGVLCEGYDNPRISAVILARPTLSLALFLQIVGRGLRIDDGKSDCMILDHAGCAWVHGFADDPREWTLDGKKKRKSDEKREAPVRVCEECFAAYPAQSASCPECGHMPEGRDTEIKTDQDGQLAEFTDEMKENLRRSRIREESQARTLEDLQALAMMRGYNPKWAWHRWNARNRHA